MKLIYTFLAIVSFSSSMYTKNNVGDFIANEISHATNNTVEKLDKNFFKYYEKLNQCVTNNDKPEKCIERVRSELKQSIKNDARALGTLLAMDLAAIAVANVAHNANLKETATAIHTTRKTLGFLPVVTTTADASLKTVLYILSGL